LKLSNPSHLACPVSLLSQQNISSSPNPEQTTSVPKQYIVGNNNVNTIYCSFTDTSLQIFEPPKKGGGNPEAKPEKPASKPQRPWAC
jgi:hypothetical protein